MSFAPPPGPPPPPMPPGWKAQFDDRYKQWFYVNLRTGASQWTAPDEFESASPPGDAPPPSYHEAGPGDPAIAAAARDDKSAAFGSNNPYGGNRVPGPSSHQNIDNDARLAAQLQAEEDARAAGNRSRGESSEYYDRNNNLQSPSPMPPRPSSSGYRDGDTPSGKRGLLGRLMGGSNSSSNTPPPPPPHPPRSPYQPQGYPYDRPPPEPHHGYPPPRGDYYRDYPPGPPRGDYYPRDYPPPRGDYYPPPQGYYAQPYPMQQQQFQDQPQKRSGLGTAGAAALGVGGGLLAGALITDAIEDHHDDGWGGGPVDGGPFDGGPVDGGYDGGFDGGF